jgi:signal transduction histidine kinase
LESVTGFFERFLSLSNPLLFGTLISLVVTVVIVLFFLKVLLPLQKKRFLEKQKHILETAELMALFSEMDPSPQIRIDSTGKIVQTNIAARRIFKGIASQDKNIKDILPMLNTEDFKTEKHFIDSIENDIFSINIRPGKNYDFINIYLYDITKQKNYEISLEDYKNKLKDLADKLDSTIEAVKKTVSQELHDDIGHSLMALKLKASHDDADTGELLTGINTVYEKVRELSKELRPADISKLGLTASVENLIANLAQSSKIKGSFECKGEEIIAGENIGTCIFRVTQEAMSNIVKHSKATEFKVCLQFSEEMIDLIIIDNGVGIPEKYFSAKNYSHFGIGLFNMKERVEKYNGTFRINSNSETGTVLIIQLPTKGK